jgi:predicted nucleic acid-binding protein
MKTTADTSVLIAAFATWHEQHAAAAAAVARVDLVLGHCLLETYSVLTRLPAPHRMKADVVASWLRVAFGKHEVASLPAQDHLELVATCTAQGLIGGAVYDALVAASCARAGAHLLTLDVRARATYATLGCPHELVGV